MRIIAAFLGALLMVAGIAARIIASSHRPGYASGPSTGWGDVTFGGRNYGWPTTTYDLVRIGGWALLIFGALIVALALIREFRKAA